MHYINNDKLLSMETRYRAQFINSLSGFKSANLIGTRSHDGINNLAIFSSVVHLGAAPALVAFVMRPNKIEHDKVERNTLENIQNTKQYTINQVSNTFYKAAHQTSARYNDKQCEFKQTGLTPFFIDGVKPPFVKESQLKYALTLQQIIPIKLNGTSLVIGEITDIICNKRAIKSDGYIDIESIDTVAVSGLDNYHTSNRLSRLSYAKPDKLLTSLTLDGKPNISEGE
jgi:flavin reductase (DIM6/NTAB) family NADH-FMN oxidoreductase RutF